MNSVCSSLSFLFTPLGKGRGMVKWEGKGVGEKREGMDGQEMEMHKKYPQNATYLVFGYARWELLPHVIIHF